MDALLEAIRAQSGAMTLHALTPRVVGQMHPEAPAIDEEVEDGEAGQDGEARGAGDERVAQLSLVTVNLDGLGSDYSETPCERMAAILELRRAVVPAPDALLFQEMAHEMLDEALQRLPTRVALLHTGG